MSILKVREYFDKYGIGDRILEFPVSSKTVEEASIAIGCEPKEIAKTLSFTCSLIQLFLIVKSELSKFLLTQSHSRPFCVRKPLRPNGLAIPHNTENLQGVFDRNRYVFFGLFLHSFGGAVPAF